MLVLPIKRKWFDLILDEIKKEEYREMKPFYTTRFVNAGLLNADLKPSGEAKYVLFRNGYSAKSRTIKALVRLTVGEGRQEWGAASGKKYYILNILRII